MENKKCATVGCENEGTVVVRGKVNPFSIPGCEVDMESRICIVCLQKMVASPGWSVGCGKMEDRV